MPFDLPILIVSAFAALGCAGVVWRIQKGREHGWIWAVGAATIYLVALNVTRRVVYEDVPSYEAAGVAYDRGLISLVQLERAKEDDVEARYKSIAAGVAVAVVSALVASRRRSGGSREEDADPPQMVGSACISCTQTILLERDGMICGRCSARCTTCVGASIVMPTIRLEIDPLFLGPVSVGTVDAIRTVHEKLGLTLKEAKDAVDACIFDGQPAMFHVRSAAAGAAICAELSRRGPPAILAVVKLPDPRELREPDGPAGGGPATFLAPDLSQLEAPLRRTFPELSSAQAERVISELGSMLYAPRCYLDCYHLGIITVTELRNKLLAHVQSGVSAEISRWVEVVEVSPMEEPLDRVLFPSQPQGT